MREPRGATAAAALVQERSDRRTARCTGTAALVISIAFEADPAVPAGRAAAAIDRWCSASARHLLHRHDRDRC